MIKNLMSLKAKINNIAKQEKVSPQAVMQQQWYKYQKSYPYAKDIKYHQLVDSIISIKKIFFK